MKTFARLGLLTAIAGMALAQSETAVVFGIIKDPAGAAIAGAAVQLRNEATGTARELQSNDNGLFYFTSLPPGSYELTVDAPGFKQYHDSHVRIQVAQVGRVDISMELGSTGEILNVEGNISVINSGNAAEGTVVTSEKLPSLPLNGRQFLQLALLAPNVNPGGRTVQQDQLRQGQNNIGSLSIAGNRTSNTNFLLDGAVNIDPDYSALNYSPSIDSIAEFQVQTAMVPAEYSRASVNVVSKSGTNDAHGSLWEFLRNKDVDARPFNVPSLYQFERNQFGANLGGALKKNRLFGFLAYEGLRVTQAGANQSGSTPVTVTLPTAAERIGNFTADKTIKDPSTGLAYPGNQIPFSQLNPISLAAVGILPNPVGGSTYVNAAEPLQQHNDNYSGRVDFAVKQQWNLFTRYSRSNENSEVPYTVPSRDSINDARSQNAALGSTYTFTPNLVNESRVGFSRLRLTLGMNEPLFDVNGIEEKLPQMNLGGSYPLFGGAGAFNTNNPGGGVALSRDTTYQIYDNVAWSHGRQAIKFGAEVEQVNYNRYEAPAALGSFQFTGKFTGNTVADFLLGLSPSASRSIGPDTIDAREWMYNFYFQDDIHVLSNLTVNLGLRYELAPPFYDLHSEMGSIDFSKVPSPQQIFAGGPLAHYTPTFFVCGEDGYPRGCAYTDKNNFAPRLGVAWAINPKTVVRAGGGFFYVNSNANTRFRMAAGLPDNLSQTLTIGTYSPATQGFNIFGPPVVGTASIQASAVDLNERTSYSTQWNFSIQRELAKNVVLEVGYLATMGLKLEQNVTPNNAQPSSNTSVDPRRPYAALAFAPGIQFANYLQVQGASVPVGFINYFPHSAQSNYESGFLRLEKRFTHGVSLLSSYTYSKAITNAPGAGAGGVNGAENSQPQNSYDLSTERGLASFDTRNRWTSTAVYDLPFGKGGRWLTDGWAAKLAGGFEASGILTLQSGFPFTINLKGDTANVGSGNGGVYVRPNVVGQSQYLSSPSTAEWFNTADFANPGAGNFGDLGRNTLIGPKIIDLDLVLQKNITLHERFRLQIRAEFFNALNHSNYNVIDRIFADPAFGAVQTQLDPRQLQFGLKMIF
jgi:hypothetical protein